MNKKIIGIFVCMLLIAVTVLPVSGIINIEKKQDSSSMNSEVEYVFDVVYYGNMNGDAIHGQGEITSIVNEEVGLAEIHINLPDFLFCYWWIPECRFLPILPEITTVLSCACCPPEPIPLPDPYDNWLKNPLDLTKGNFTATNKINYYLNDTYIGYINTNFSVQTAGYNTFNANVSIYGNVYPYPPAGLSTPEGYEMLLHQEGPGVLLGSYSQNLTAPNNTYFNYSVERTYNYSTDEQLACDEICVFELEYINSSEDDLMALAYGHYEPAYFASIESIKGGFGYVNTVIKNTGRMDIPEGFLQVNITVDGPLILLGKKTVMDDPIPITINEEMTIKSNFILGFGPAFITVEVVFQDLEGKYNIIDKVEKSGFVLLFLVLGVR